MAVAVNFVFACPVSFVVEISVQALPVGSAAIAPTLSREAIAPPKRREAIAPILPRE